MLALRSAWAAAEPDLTDRLIRAVWRAGRWLSDPSSHTLAAELLARPDHLDVAPEIVDRSLGGRVVIAADGESRRAERFLLFHESAAQFPWRSQAEWIGGQIAVAAGLDPIAAAARAGGAFRTDIYRRALAATSVDLPAASSRIEGAPSCDTAVASCRGETILYRNAFFDGRQSEPAFS